jgi:glycosyltransferase involved in cell wall biosynthesis
MAETETTVTRPGGSEAGSGRSASPPGHRGRPRVLLVGLGLELSGSGRFLTGLAAQLARDGWDTGLFVVRGGPLRPELDGAGVDLTVASPGLPEGAGRFRLGLAPLLRLIGYIRRTRPDIVHTNLFGLDLIGRIAAFACGVPVVMSTQHDLNPRPALVNAFRRLTVPRIAATVACSEPVAAYCRDVMRVPADRLLVIENGVDTRRFDGAAAPMRTPPRFLAMGALVPPKAHAVLIEAFARVVAELPGSVLTISGDGPLRDELLGQVGSLHLEGAVRIVPPSPDVVGLLSDSDIFVQSSVREGLPQALLEAMAAGKPVVATDVSSHASVLEEGRCGVLVSPNDPTALAEALVRLASNPATAAGLGRAAALRVRERYSLQRMAREYEALYERLYAASQPRA